MKTAIVWAFLGVLFFGSDGLAYIDPGTGFAFVSGIGALVMGFFAIFLGFLTITFKKWKKFVKTLFLILKAKLKRSRP